MSVNIVSQENFSLSSAGDAPSEKLADQAKRISVCFENTTGNRICLDHVRLQGVDLPSSMELSGGESKVFCVSWDGNEDSIRNISYSYLIFQGSSASGGIHNLSLDLSKDKTIISLGIYQEAFYGEKGHYCGSISRLWASVKNE